MKKRIISAIAAVLVAASTLTASSAAASTSLETQISQLEDKLAQAAEARKQAQKAIDDAKNEKSDALAEKSRLDKKISSLESEIDMMIEYIAALELQISEKIKEIADEENNADEIYKTIRSRIRVIHERGNLDVLSVLLNADGLVEFFTELDRFYCMLDYDKRLMQSYNDSIAELTALKGALDFDKVEQLSRLAELESSKQELNRDRDNAANIIANAEKNAKDAEKTLAQVEALERQYNEEREKKLAEIQKSSNDKYVGGEFLWPLPQKHTMVTSGFGYRTHPVTGKPQFHNGIDIPAPYGTEIYAVNSGTVIEVSYNYADGQYITISHGGGVASFYSHISRSSVKVGDKVKRGQVIGYVGTSGYTTGAHLNLNVYENNVAVNPMKFFS